MAVSLKDFVRQTLVEIVQGVDEARTVINASASKAVISPAPINPGDDRVACWVDDNGTQRNMTGQVVHFDLATHAEESVGASGGFKVAVASVFKAGVDADGKATDKTVSRVQFSVPIVLEPAKSNQTTISTISRG